MKNSIDAGEVRTLEATHSIADGLMAVRPGDLNFAHVRKFVDRLVTVEDEEIAGAVRWLFVEREDRRRAERRRDRGGGARATPPTYTPPVVAIVSGGNLDPEDLARYTVMRIELFEMERMQSTWENLVDYDMSESGVRPLTLRELTGWDSTSSRSSTSRSATASRTARSSCASGSPRSIPARRVDHVEVTNGTSEANYLIALSQMRAGRRRRDAGPELHADAGRGAEPRRRGADVPPAHRRGVGAGLGRVRARGHAEDAAALPVEPEQPDRLGPVRRRDARASSIAASRPARGCSPTRSISAPKSTGRGRRASGA